jgi:hypothetical protein
MKLNYMVLLACLCLAGCVTPTYVVSPPPPGPTLAEVQSMVEAHVSDGVIVSQVQNSSTRYVLTTDQIIALKNAGASETVLSALINSAAKAPVQTAPAVVGPYPYVYPSVYIDPWPFFWWGVGPHYYGGYGHGYYHGGRYPGGGYHGGGHPH